MRKASGGQKGVRKVRTAGGSRYYGLPIGSPITADDIARAKARNGGAEAPAPERASAKETKRVLDAPKPKEPNALQRLNRKVQTGRSKPSNAETEAARAKEIQGVGEVGGSVSVGQYVYAVPKGVSLHPSPTGGPSVYAISPDETVRILTASGIVDLDDEMSEQVLDRLVPGADENGNDRASIATPDPDEANAEYDNAVAAHKEQPTDESAKAVTKAAKKVVASTRTPKPKADSSSEEDDLPPEIKARTEELNARRADIAARMGAQLRASREEAGPEGKVESEGAAAAREALEAELDTWYEDHAALSRDQFKAMRDAALARQSEPLPDWRTDTSKSKTSEPKSFSQQMDQQIAAGEAQGEPETPPAPEATGPSRRSQEQAAALATAAKEPKAGAPRSMSEAADQKAQQMAAKTRLRDKGPADPSKPLGNGNWDATSMGRSTPPPNAEEIGALKASPYTSKHLDANGNFTPERVAVHDAIIEAFLEGLESQQNPVQYMNGGGPASGKGTMTKGKNAELTQYPAARGVNDITGEIEAMDTPPGALLIDPDAIKMQLPEVKEARARQAENAGTDDDKQWAGSSHEESSQLAKRLHRAALERGYNVIYDGTGNGSPNSVRSKVRAAKSLGYRVEANYLYLEPQEGIGRAKLRADRANRIVPADQITGTYAKLPAIFDELKEDGLFDKVNLFDNNVPYGEPAKHIGTGDGSNFEILDPEAYQKYMSSRERTEATRFQASAEQVIGQYSSMEPEITSFMEDMAAEFGVELTGLNHRLKTPESLSRKMVDVASKAGLTPEEAQNHVRDALRYTMRIPDETYVETVQRVLEEFRRHNYEIDAKNSWAPGAEYMGINVTVTDPETDRSFEVQFHTPESLRVKHDENHPLYAINRTAPRGSKEYLARQLEMIENSKRIPVPDGVYDLVL